MEQIGGSPRIARTDLDTENVVVHDLQVNIYYLVTKGSVEEDIKERAKKKMLSLAAEQKATAVLQVPWPAAKEKRRSIYDEQPQLLLLPLWSTQIFYLSCSPHGNTQLLPQLWTHCTRCSKQTNGLTHFPPVEAPIAALVQPANLSLLSKDVVCPNKQCRLTEVILKKAYAASAFTAQLGSILVAYQTHLLGSIAETHKPSPQQLNEPHLVSRNLLWLSKLSGQAIGRNLVPVRRQLWLSQAQVRR
ncbi:UNVERIFIED_CONTAM: hypothetical protein FKN15_030984 [Acipenser sinensis]